jgi:hypothetical protein
LSYSHDDDLRRYDEAIFNWLDFELPDDSGVIKPIPKILSTPDRAFAKLAEDLDARFPLPNGAKRSQDDVTLPICSVMRMGDPELDWGRFNMTPVKLGWTKGFDGAYVAPHPDPYTITYQIDLWMKRQRHANSLVMQFLRKFVGDICVIQVPIVSETSEYRDFRAVTPTHVCELFNDGMMDTSDLEPGEDKNRTIRKSVTVRAAAWLMKEAVVKPTVRRVQIEFENDQGSIENVGFDEDTIEVIG